MEKLHGVAPILSTCDPRGVRVELINTGSELLVGRVLNTQQQWLGQQLSDAGYEPSYQQTIPDTGDAIQPAVREAIEQRIGIVTGGLGPTSDISPANVLRSRWASLWRNTPRPVNGSLPIFKNAKGPCRRWCSRRKYHTVPRYCPMTTVQPRAWLTNRAWLADTVAWPAARMRPGVYQLCGAVAHRGIC